MITPLCPPSASMSEIAIYQQLCGYRLNRCRLISPLLSRRFPGSGVTLGSSPRLSAAMMASSSLRSSCRASVSNRPPSDSRNCSRRTSAIRTEMASSQSHGPSVPSRCRSSSSANLSGVTLRGIGRAATTSIRTRRPAGTAKAHMAECSNTATRTPGATRAISRIAQPEPPCR